MDLNRLKPDELCSRVVDDVMRGNIYSDNPMSASTTKSLKDHTSLFRSNYLEFWDKLLRGSSETDDLFHDLCGGGRVGARSQDIKEHEAHALSRYPLFDALIHSLELFSGVRVRKVRVAATEAGLQMITSLVHIAKIKAETRDLKQRQLDTEVKKKRPNLVMTRTLKDSLERTQDRIHSVEGMIKDSFNKIFTHRFRDIDPYIRSICMRSIGHWMREHPLFFLSDFYLKYLGWSLNDKDPQVRSEVLIALRELYSASSENLALMDTFNARFISRVRDMLSDVDASVVAEAVSTLAVLHRAGVLAQDSMECVLPLLVDGQVQIRNAAAAVVPTLISANMNVSEEPQIDGEHKYVKNLQNTVRSSRNTLLAVVRIINGLCGSRARTACVVDALWSFYQSFFCDWNLVCEMLHSDEHTHDSQKDVSQYQLLNREDAVGLSNLLVCAVRRAHGENLVTDSSGGNSSQAKVLRQPTKARREANEKSCESFTYAAMKHFHDLLHRWRSEDSVLAPLIECIRFLKLTHYSVQHKESEFETLLKYVNDIFLQHSNRRVICACTDAIHHVATNGWKVFTDVGKHCTHNMFEKVTERLITALFDIRTAKNENEGCLEKQMHPCSPMHSEASDLEMYDFRVRVGLERLNALLSLLPQPTPTEDTIRTKDIFDELLIIISDATISSAIGLRSIAMATRAASLLLMHRFIALLSTPKLSKKEVEAHILARDQFVSSAVDLAKLVADQFPHSRILPKAIISAIANLVVYHQHLHVLDVNTTECAGQQADLVDLLDLFPTNAAIRTIWDTCNHLLDVSCAETDSRDDKPDLEITGDQEVSKLAYCLALCDVAVTPRGFIAAEFLANRGHSGQWADLAITALLVDLRRLGPHVTASTITTSLVSAFAEVNTGDEDSVNELEEAFRELAGRLAGMFLVSSQKDRVVVRCIIEEGLNFVVPTAKPHIERLGFLSLGLSAFVPKLGTRDAKSLIESLSTVVTLINEEDKQYNPLFDFVRRVSGRDRGGSCGSASFRKNTDTTTITK